jgi:hypothetical protein
VFGSRVRATGTASEYSEVPRVDRESVVRKGSRSQGSKDLLRRFHCRSAPLAYKVAVSLGREVVGGRAMAKVRVDHNPESLEFVQVAVDRRQMDVRRDGLNLGGEVLGRAVSRALEEATEKQTPRRGDPPALGPE